MLFFIYKYAPLVCGEEILGKAVAKDWRKAKPLLQPRNIRSQVTFLELIVHSSLVVYAINQTMYIYYLGKNKYTIYHQLTKEEKQVSHDLKI